MNHLKKLILKKNKIILELKKELHKIKDNVTKEQHNELKNTISAIQMEIINVREETKQC